MDCQFQQEIKVIVDIENAFVWLYRQFLKLNTYKIPECCTSGRKLKLGVGDALSTLL